MLREERREIALIGDGRAEERAGAGAVRGVGDRGEIGAEVGADGIEARIVDRDLLLQEHLHAAPIARRVGVGAEAAAEVADELAGARTFQPDGETDGGFAAHERREDASGTEGADDFVVAFVNDEEIGFERGAVVGDAAHEVGVDGGDGGIDDLEMLLRIRGKEHRFQHAADRERWLGVAHRGGAAENEDAVGARRFLLWKAKRLRPADESG